MISGLLLLLDLQEEEEEIFSIFYCDELQNPI